MVRLFGFAREIVRDPLSVHPRLPTASRKTETPGRAPSFAWSRKTIWKKSVHEGQMQILRIRTFGSRRRRRKNRSVQPLQQAFRRQVPGGAFDIPAGSRRTAEPKSVVRLSNGGRSRQACNDHAKTEDELLSLLRAAHRRGRPVLLQLRDASVGSKTGPTGRGQDTRVASPGRGPSAPSQNEVLPLRRGNNGSAGSSHENEPLPEMQIPVSVRFGGTPPRRGNGQVRLWRPDSDNAEGKKSVRSIEDGR